MKKVKSTKKVTKKATKPIPKVNIERMSDKEALEGILYHLEDIKQKDDSKISWFKNFDLKWYFLKKDITYMIPYSVRDGWYKFKCFLFPKGKKYRKAIPNTWVDVSCLIEDVNFAFVTGFYEDEYKAGIVDWERSGAVFAKWLEKAYEYITVERPQLQKDLDAAYPDISANYILNKTTSKKTYQEEYGEVNRIEALIKKKDTKILTEIVKYRDYFWT